MENTDKYAYYIGLADKLAETRDLTDEEFLEVLLCDDPEFDSYLAQKAREVREKIYGKEVYLRGLVEFSNYCKNNCRYCGIRRDNRNAQRYRLSEEEIFRCSDMGHG